MPDHIRGQVYIGQTTPSGLTPDDDGWKPPQPSPRLTVEPTRAGDPHVHLWVWDPEHGEQRGVLLHPDSVERLGIDLQIRTSYLRGVRPPSGPEPDPVAGPDDEPLIPGTTACECDAAEGYHEPCGGSGVRNRRPDEETTHGR